MIDNFLSNINCINVIINVTSPDLGYPIINKVFGDGFWLINGVWIVSSIFGTGFWLDDSVWLDDEYWVD